MTQPPPTDARAQELVFTLYGDYLLGRGRPVWTGSLITLLGRLGVRPMAVRTALSRMVRRGWLTVERRSTRSYHGLTRRGLRLLEEGRRRIYHPPRAEPWDGTWYLVTYSIPEARRRVRDQLRVRLQWLGCGPLAGSVWITPHDVRNEVAEVAEALRISRHVEVFRASHLGYSDAPQLVSRCWDLEAVNARYASFIARWSSHSERCRSCKRTGGAVAVPHDCADAAECFRRRFLLVHEYRSFPLQDPFLPQALLPQGWRGEEAGRLFEAYHDVLTVPAERYVAAVVGAGDGARAGRALAVNQ